MIRLPDAMAEEVIREVYRSDEDGSIVRVKLGGLLLPGDLIPKHLSRKLEEEKNSAA